MGMFSIVRKRRSGYATHIHKFLSICKSNFASNISHHLVLAFYETVKGVLWKAVEMGVPSVEGAEELDEPRKPDMLEELTVVV